MAKKEEKEVKETSLIIRSVDLPAEKKAMMQLATPSEFIKVRPGKGGKNFTYVEGGYVVAMLNKIFSPIGWGCTYKDRLIETTEVITTCTLTIKDFKTGFEISKESSGCKDRIAGITLGNTIKAAETDALKKAAAKLGIALDVYWGQMESEKIPKGADGGMDKDKEKPKKMTEEDKTNAEARIFTASLSKISSESDPTILRQFREKIEALQDVYTQAHKHQLLTAIDKKLGVNKPKTDGKLFQ